MYPLYRDLRERLGVPKWIDRHGVPRYSEFSPEEAAEIYCDYVALLEVECQSCGKTFQCAKAVSWCHEAIRHGEPFPENTPEAMATYLFGWGDAPWHTFAGAEDAFDSQCSGTTMSTDIKVLGYWQKQRFEWIPIENPERFL